MSSLADRRARSPRPYVNHHLDSRHWARFTPREGDIVVSTSYKSGTTWMQYILLHLVLPEHAPKPNTVDVSPWLDERTIDLDAALRTLDAQTHQRIIKSHLPADGLPLHDGVRYVIVARDARDVFMSLWNHYRHLSPAAYRSLRGGPDAAAGAPFPDPPADARAFWRAWIARGWFEGETEGYPFWGNLRHTASWWAERDRENVLLVHFADLLADPAREIARVAAHVGVRIDRARALRVAEATAFSRMKAVAHTFLENDGSSFVGGARRFIHRGTNGRWRDVLTEADLALWKAAVERELPAGAARWLEHGSAALARPSAVDRAAGASA